VCICVLVVRAQRGALVHVVNTIVEKSDDKRLVGKYFRRAVVRATSKIAAQAAAHAAAHAAADPEGTNGPAPPMAEPSFKVSELKPTDVEFTGQFGFVHVVPRRGTGDADFVWSPTAAFALALSGADAVAPAGSTASSSLPAPTPMLVPGATAAVPPQTMSADALEPAPVMWAAATVVESSAPAEEFATAAVAAEPAEGGPAAPEAMPYAMSEAVPEAATSTSASVMPAPPAQPAPAPPMAPPPAPPAQEQPWEQPVQPPATPAPQESPPLLATLPQVGELWGAAESVTSPSALSAPVPMSSPNLSAPGDMTVASVLAVTPSTGATEL